MTLSHQIIDFKNMSGSENLSGLNDLNSFNNLSGLNDLYNLISSKNLYFKVKMYIFGGLLLFITWKGPYFIFYCTLVSNAKGNLAKSNKSELWNRLSYRGLIYHYEVRSQSFRNNCQISRSQPQNLEADFHWTSTTSKGLSENSKKMS